MYKWAYLLGKKKKKNYRPTDYGTYLPYFSVACYTNTTTKIGGPKHLPDCPGQVEVRFSQAFLKDQEIRVAQIRAS